jgi:hypothetical protein
MVAPMGENIEQRGSLRHAVQLPIVYRVPGAHTAHLEAGWTRDLSEGGIGLELPERLRTDTMLEMRVRTTRGSVRVEAQVLWVGLPTTSTGGTPHGLAFKGVHPSDVDTLQALLAALRNMSHAGSRLPLDLAVACRPSPAPGVPLGGRTLNVSRGGLALQLPAIVPARTEVSLTLHTTREQLAVEGVVAWVEPESRRRPGALIAHGVQFTALDWSLALTLGAILIDQEENPRPG